MGIFTVIPYNLELYKGVQHLEVPRYAIPLTVKYDKDTDKIQIYILIDLERRINRDVETRTFKILINGETSNRVDPHYAETVYVGTAHEGTIAHHVFHIPTKISDRAEYSERDDI